MKNKKLFNTIVKISLISMVLAMSFQVLPVNAAGLTLMSDEMSRLKAATASNHDVKFKTPTGVDASTDTIILTFSAQFVMGAVAFADMDLEVDAACDGVYEINKTLAAAPGASPIWGAVKAGQLITLTAPTNAAAGEIALGACVRVEIGTNAAGPGVNQITNGAVDIGDSVAIAGTFGDTGTIVVDIITDDQVVITATIDPTFTFVISTNTCALGTLTTAAVATCNYTLAVGTNAVSGAKITVQAITDGTNALLNGNTTPANNINNIAEDGAVTLGVEGYGIALTAGGTWAESGDFADDDTPIPSSVTEMLSIATPVLVSVTNSVTHRAAIDASTQADSYTQTVQYIATGTF